MARSPLYDLQERHTLTFTPKGKGGKVRVVDPKTNTASYVPAKPGRPVALEVFLIAEGQGNRSQAGRAGLEQGSNAYTMMIVGTKGSAPLKLPEGLGAGDKAEVTLLGRRGTVEIQPTMPPQIPDVSDEQGWLYVVTFEAVRNG